MKNLLFEIGIQEIPYNISKILSEHFVSKIKYLLEQKFVFQGTIALFTTPRRIGILVKNLHIPDNISYISEHINIPSSEEQLCKIGRKFLKVHNIKFEHVTIGEDDIGTFLIYLISGREELTRLIHIALNSLEDTYKPNFQRSVINICSIIDDTVLPFKKWGIYSSNVIYALRNTPPIVLNNSMEYETSLLARGIIPCFIDRKSAISQAIDQYKHLSPILNDDILNSVTGDVEIANLALCTFNEKCLEIEALTSNFIRFILTKKHSCIFLMNKSDQTMSHHFLVALNTPLNNGIVIKYWNKVVNDLLENVYFFYKLDGSDISFETLKSVIHSEKLGTVYDQVMRLCACIENIACFLPSLHLANTIRACKLSKCDMVKTIVREYPVLSYIMSSHYAHLANEIPEVVNIIKNISFYYWHEMNLESLILNIAQHLEYIFSNHIVFNSITDKSLSLDPFEIRRYVNRLIYLLKEVDLPLEVFIKATIMIYDSEYRSLEMFFTKFLTEKIVQHYKDSDLYRILPDKYKYNLFQVETRIKYFEKHKIALKSLLQIYKRITNILKNNAHVNLEFDKQIADNNEQKIYEQITSTIPNALDLQFTYLIDIANNLEQFFRDYLILSPDHAIKNNRILILEKALNVFSLIICG